jgi:hypothetical protein
MSIDYSQDSSATVPANSWTCPLCTYDFFQRYRILLIGGRWTSILINRIDCENSTFLLPSQLIIIHHVQFFPSLLGIICIDRKHDAVVRLGIYDPYRNSRLFQIRSYFEISKSFVESQETDVGLFANAFQYEAAHVFVAIMDICFGLASKH